MLVALGIFLALGNMVTGSEGECKQKFGLIIGGEEGERSGPASSAYGETTPWSSRRYESARKISV
jgi:hypothetical protein